MGLLRPSGQERGGKPPSPPWVPSGAWRLGIHRRRSPRLDCTAWRRSEDQRMRPVDRVLERLESVKSRGNDYQALCPAHDDHNPSLSIGEGEDGRAIVNCFAGCETEDVVAALGLEMRDLFESRNGHKKEFHSIPSKTRATV